MLKQVHFAGIKSLVDVTVDLEPLTVIVGPNGCGKSTLLDQIERVVGAATPAPSPAHVLGALGKMLTNDEAEELRTAGLTLRSMWEARLSNQRSVKVVWTHSALTPWYDATSVSIDAAGATATLRADADGDARTAFDSLAATAFDGRAQRLALVPGRISRPCPVDLRGLEVDGYRLPSVLMYMSTRHREAYAALHEDMAKVIPHFRSIWIGNERRGVEGTQPLFSLDLVMSQGRVPAHQVSDGTLITLALLTAVHNPDLPSLVLMDDLDHGLHLGAQFELVNAIRRVMERRPELQVVCTTHSPVLLDCVTEREVRVMALDAQGHSHIKPLAEHPRTEEWRTAYSPGELWANLGEEWVLDG